MKKKKLLLSNYKDVIILQRGNDAFLIRKGEDDEVFFSSSIAKFELQLDESSKDCNEWQTYVIFEDLIESIIKRCAVDSIDESVTLENRCIKCHSDSNTDNILMIRDGDGLINVSITKTKNSDARVGNIVRVSTDSSYYQEFVKFYQKMKKLEKNVNKDDDMKKVDKRGINNRKKVLSLFRH